MKNRLGMAAGLACVLIFAVLFSVRLGLFSGPPVEFDQEAAAQAAAQSGDRDSWMNILQDGKKIGYAHRTFKKTEQGYSVSESSYMEINVMGSLQKIQVDTFGALDKNMGLSSFSFNLRSDMFSFFAVGRMEADGLVVDVGRGKDKSRMTLPMDKPPFLGIGLAYAEAVRGLKKGGAATIPVFDPATMGTKDAVIKYLGEETFEYFGEKIPVTKISIEVMNNPQTAWIGPSGEILAEEGLLGLRVEKTSAIQALDKETIKRSGDLAVAASIPVDKTIKDPESLSSLTLELHGVDSFVESLDGGRQKFQAPVLTIEQRRPPSLKDAREYDGDPAYLESDPFVQADHPEIKAVAEEITSPDDSPAEKVRKIIFWANDNLEQTPVLSVPQALQTLRNRKGDCNEHAMLAAALARAAGVPARIEVGVYYLDGAFLYHAWNSFWVGDWITGDAVFRQFPADVAHVRFSRGGPQAQFDMIGLMGRLKIKVLEQKS